MGVAQVASRCQHGSGDCVYAEAGTHGHHEGPEDPRQQREHVFAYHRQCLLLLTIERRSQDTANMLHDRLDCLD